MSKKILKGTILPEVLTKAQIDAIDDHIHEHDNDHRVALARGDLSGEGLKTFNFCGLVAKAEPIIQVAISLLFWKPKWQDVLRQLLTAAEAICPVAN